jgi:hypothetical protein
MDSTSIYYWYIALFGLASLTYVLRAPLKYVAGEAHAIAMEYNSMYDHGDAGLVSEEKDE